MRRPFDLSLYLVTDRALARARPIVQIVQAVVGGGVTMVQLREKNLPVNEFIDLAVAIKTTLPAHVPLIINDDVEVALASHADGVHLGQDDMDPRQARLLLGEWAIIGLSVGSVRELKKFDPAFVDYVGIGPAYATQTKPDAGAALGVAGINALRARINVPCVAIGGINQCNANEVMSSGVNGIAVVSAICSAADPKAAAHALKQIVQAR